MSNIVIIGTSHAIQRNIFYLEFINYIDILISQLKIKAIAEEIDIESTLFQLAKRRKIKYVSIDPNPEERAALGIPSLNQIDNCIFMEFDDNDSKDARIECEKRKQDAYRAREKEWLKRVASVQDEPILVVCGANHFEPFSKLLEQNGFLVNKYCALWE